MRKSLTKLLVIQLMSLFIFIPVLAEAKNPKTPPPPYEERLPASIDTGGEAMILVNPRIHAWGAYDANGQLVRAGLATAGGNYCPDIRKRCRTSVGVFRIYSLGGAGCRSNTYPIPRGGAPMPYCMFFNKGYALHGSPHVFEGNGSHGCVRLKVKDAAWIRFNFAQIGTKVVILPY